VAFAFGRAFGPAVARNRIRRQLRAILREFDRSIPLPPGLMLIGGKPSVIELTFDDLRSEMDAMISEVRRRAVSST
jgi:ribonuclease P protein component